MKRLTGLKIIMFFTIIHCIYFSTSIFADKKESTSLDKSDEEYIMNKRNEDCYFPEEGMVPDAETAKKIAMAVWIPIYGEESISKRLPLKAKLVGDSLWLIKGTLESPSDGSIICGGVPYAKIMKSNGQILCVIHTQ